MQENLNIRINKKKLAQTFKSILYFIILKIFLNSVIVPNMNDVQPIL